MKLEVLVWLQWKSAKYLVNSFTKGLPDSLKCVEGAENKEVKQEVQNRRSYTINRLAVVVFITISNCRYNIIWKSLSRKESDNYAPNKIIFHGFAVIRLIRSFILA